VNVRSIVRGVVVMPPMIFRKFPGASVAQIPSISINKANKVAGTLGSPESWTRVNKAEMTSAATNHGLRIEPLLDEGEDTILWSNKSVFINKVREVFPNYSSLI
jgi:hypothetical protein